MSIAVSAGYRTYPPSIGMSFFGRYGSATERSTSLTLAHYRGTSSEGSKLEQLARRMEDFYVNYNGQQGLQKPTSRQPKLGALRGAEVTDVPFTGRRETGYIPGRRTCSVPVITSSILKSSPSSPTSPKGKKIVRFADSHGLPLATIHRKLSSKQEELGHERVELGEVLKQSHVEEGKALKEGHKDEASPELPSPMKHDIEYHFTQPGIEPDFMSHVLRNKVCLENIKHDGASLRGVVRVSNLDYHKSVSIRWTDNGWRSVHDKPAVFCAGGSDSITDRFSFQLPLAGSRLEFAIQYCIGSSEFWDNNKENNYVISFKLHLQ